MLRKTKAFLLLYYDLFQCYCCIRYGPVAMVHVDSHSDCTDSVSGEKIMHGTPFKRAIDENLLVCDKVFQIGIRGCLSNTTGFEFQRKKVYIRYAFYR